ncbi:hypothetical protein LE181_12545 [Streptomyces sp. SCA3-4]|uniref:hypothetical protein n=1 Tax=Streptomyces sichuanensis TaxID=2871810 RepID=UPI001CE2FF2B|nr:hypothetical protein [Streptomyces sichuanensis]MCA6092986.1 hypothetical protein [Streptomyces sichuanensis]
MEHEMRAEYEEGVSSTSADAPIRLWHMVRLDGTQGMCGRDLDPRAATQSADAWGTPQGEPFCHSCAALYLREVP